ncbi:MAG: RNA polymerase sigma factor WhiG, partial [Deltaproteobacteria bacterium]|nr:RNA polymerase sigma factor WhiG [Deltaproteobacteria bacterium]
MTRPKAQKFKDYTQAYFQDAGKLTAAKRNELILAYAPLIKYI